MAGQQSLNPWQQYQQSPTWLITLQTDGGKGKDLTGLLPANLQLLIRPQSGADIIGTGTFTILSAGPPAIVTYAPSAADVATAGNFNLFVIIFYATGPDYVGGASGGGYPWSVNAS